MATETMANLIHEARRGLNLHIDGDLARFLGVSQRTVQRHAKTAGIPIGDGHQRLARALYPQNPDLALRIARSFNVDLSDLVAAANAQVAVAKANVAADQRTARSEHVALMILAACDALDLPPRQVRPVLAAIFERALALGVELDQLAKLLAANGTESPDHP